MVFTMSVWLLYQYSTHPLMIRTMTCLWCIHIFYYIGVCYKGLDYCSKQLESTFDRADLRKVYKYNHNEVAVAVALRSSVCVAGVGFQVGQKTPVRYLLLQVHYSKALPGELCR